MKRVLDPAPYVGRDPRDIPAYRFAEAAHYLQMPKATLRAWALGQGNFRPVLQLPEPATRSGPRLLCFMNLVELHVLDALRREHQVPLPQVRKALRFLGGASFRTTVGRWQRSTFLRTDSTCSSSTTQS